MTSRWRVTTRPLSLLLLLLLTVVKDDDGGFKADFKYNLRRINKRKQCTMKQKESDSRTRVCSTSRCAAAIICRSAFGARKSKDEKEKRLYGRKRTFTYYGPQCGVYMRRYIANTINEAYTSRQWTCLFWHRPKMPVQQQQHQEVLSVHAAA